MVVRMRILEAHFVVPPFTTARRRARRTAAAFVSLVAPLAAACESPPPTPTDAAMAPRPDAFVEIDAGNMPDAPQADAPSPDGASELSDAGGPADAWTPPACTPLPTDYPGSADYACPAVSGSANYPRIASSVSSIARIEQYQEIARLLFDPTTDPPPMAFADARTHYATAEGIGSRVVRRFDLHFAPPTAMGPGRLCQSEASWRASPLFCVGPATLNPIVNEMLQRGFSADPSEPSRLYAARIEAALLWFIHVSIYKEATTCALLYPGNDGKREDCDSAWAYYTGGRERSARLEDEIGLAREVRHLSERGHERILDGIFAVRCWRDIDTSGMAPDPLPAYDMPDLLTHRALFERAREQLDVALDHGFARILIDRLRRMRETSGDEQRYHLTFLRTLLAPIAERTVSDVMYPAREPLFDRTLREVSPADADFVRDEIQREPGSIDVDGIIRRIDAAFRCP